MTMDELKKTLTDEVASLETLVEQLEKARKQAKNELLVAKGRLGQTRAILNVLPGEEDSENEDQTGPDTEE